MEREREDKGAEGASCKEAASELVVDLETERERSFKTEMCIFERSVIASNW